MGELCPQGRTTAERTHALKRLYSRSGNRACEEAPLLEYKRLRLVCTPERASRFPLLMYVGTAYNHLQPIINSCVIHNTQKCQREEGEGELSVGNGGKSLIFLVFNAQEGEGGERWHFCLSLRSPPPLPVSPEFYRLPSSGSEASGVGSFWCSKLYQRLSFGNLRGDTPRPLLARFRVFFYIILQIVV